MWVLRENLIGPNVGRWDYLNSREEMFRHDPAMVIPDPNTVTMTEPSLSYYTMRNALLALLAGGMPIGGMAAQMQNPQAPENDPKALRDIWFDKLRERLTGLFKIDGKIHDTYRQSWVATITPSYVEAGRESLVTDVDDLQTVVDKLKPEEKKRLEDLGLLKDGTDRAARAVGSGSDAREAVFRRRAHSGCCRGRRARRPKTDCAMRCTCRRSSCTSSCSATTPRRFSIRAPVCGS